MGRLTEQKGFDRLLRAYATIAASHPQWRLRIIGDGPLRNDLEELTRELGISAIVEFTGMVKQPDRLLRHADMFVMASRFEGFPYAALEAMANGLPVVYSDCPSGPREIVRHGIDGMLAPDGDETALASAMEKLMNDSALRAQMARAAVKVLDRFGLARTIDQWETLFDEIRPTAAY